MQNLWLLEAQILRRLWPHFTGRFSLMLLSKMKAVRRQCMVLSMGMLNVYAHRGLL